MPPAPPARHCASGIHPGAGCRVPGAGCGRRSRNPQGSLKIRPFCGRRSRNPPTSRTSRASFLLPPPSHPPPRPHYRLAPSPLPPVPALPVPPFPRQTISGGIVSFAGRAGVARHNSGGIVSSAGRAGVARHDSGGIVSFPGQAGVGIRRNRGERRGGSRGGGRRGRRQEGWVDAAGVTATSL